MILFCPWCGVQHIDKAEAEEGSMAASRGAWTNPPHRSHLCAYCSHIWRPADVPTNGVREITTTGQNDTPEPVRGVIGKSARFKPLLDPDNPDPNK